MEDFLQRFNSKTQIKFIKLKILVREQLEIEEDQITDIEIFRFLLLWDKDIDIALDKIEQHIEWEKQNKELLQKSAEYDMTIEKEMKKIGCQMNYYGITKKNRPLWIMQFGEESFINIFQDHKDDFLIFNIQYIKRLQSIIFKSIQEETGKIADGTVLIIDVQNIKTLEILKNIGLQKQLSYASEILQKNYPETNKRVYIINSGQFFTAIWNLLKKILDKKITQKIQILNNDYLTVLENEVDIDKLPVCIGGKSEVKINDYKNIWDEKYEQSLKDKNFG